jgi:SAM-dependent methyltransferase
MSKTTFDDLTELYEAMIDWPKRLANEEPFYRHWFDKITAKSVVDVACGTGRHAAKFHEWGLQIEGADLSHGMIDRARSSFGEGERLRWIVRGFDQPIDLEKNKTPFDAALCMGNSLALAPNLEIVDRAIQQMFAAIRPGGIVVIQVLNLWQLPDGPCVWQKCKLAKMGQKSFSPEPTATAGGCEDSEFLLMAASPNAVAVGSGLNEENQKTANDVLILKGVHRNASCGYVEFLAASPTEGKLLHHESVRFLGLEATHLEQSARAAGAKAIHFFGDYKQHPYKPEKSPDLIMVAEK